MPWETCQLLEVFRCLTRQQLRQWTAKAVRGWREGHERVSVSDKNSNFLFATSQDVALAPVRNTWNGGSSSTWALVLTIECRFARARETQPTVQS